MFGDLNPKQTEQLVRVIESVSNQQTAEALDVMAAGNRNISGGIVSPQTITVNSSGQNDYVISNTIAGLLGGVNKSGTSPLRLDRSERFTGRINVNAGKLSADVTSLSSALGCGAVTLAAGSTLELSPRAYMSVNGLSGRYFSTAPDGTTNGNGTLTNFNFSQLAGAMQVDTNSRLGRWSRTTAQSTLRGRAVSCGPRATRF